MGDLRGHRIFLNEDGPDSYAKEINDGRPGYTEPCLDQAVEMGKIVKEKNLFGYIYKGRKFRRTQGLRKADFAAVCGLAEGFEANQEIPNIRVISAGFIRNKNSKNKWIR